jgi:hypothetical protein
MWPRAVLNDALLNTVSGSITVEEYAFLGHGVALLTGTHDVSRTGLERQLAVPSEGRDIVIGLERGSPRGRSCSGPVG